MLSLLRTHFIIIIIITRFKFYIWQEDIRRKIKMTCCNVDKRRGRSPWPSNFIPFSHPSFSSSHLLLRNAYSRSACTNWQMTAPNVAPNNSNGGIANIAQWQLWLPSPSVTLNCFHTTFPLAFASKSACVRSSSEWKRDTENQIVYLFRLERGAKVQTRFVLIRNQKVKIEIRKMNRTTTISYEDFHQICRFCLTHKSPDCVLNPLFHDANAELTNMLGEMISACLGIQVCCMQYAFCIWCN